MSTHIIYGFLKESLVNAPEAKRIEEYAPGDPLYVLPSIYSDGKPFEPVLDSVYRTIYCYINEFVALYTKRGFIKGSPEQTLYADGRMLPMREIQAGMLLLTIDGEKVPVVRTVSVRVCAPTYCLLLRNRGNCFVKNFLAGYPAQ